MDKPLVKVTWYDSHSSATTEYGENDYPHEAAVVITYGLLLRNDEVGVSVANELLDQTTYRGFTFIPASLLVKVEPVLRPRKTRKPKAVEAHES